MNLYEKINKTKQALQSAGLKKSGRNDFAKYEYFELADFMPTIVQMENELKFICAVSFGTDLAVLEVIDGEKPEDRHSYTSPMSSANLKGMHDVQNLGAVQTYLRRYLYVNAFEIVEHDALDKAKPAEPAKQTPKITNLQSAEFQSLISKCHDPEAAKAKLKQMREKKGAKSLSALSVVQADTLIDEFSRWVKDVNAEIPIDEDDTPLPFERGLI